ncbi:uncharacterized [Tachysurus ichikawai]
MTYAGPLLSEQDHMWNSMNIQSLRNQDLSQCQLAFSHLSITSVSLKSKGYNREEKNPTFLTALHLTEGAVSHADWSYSWCTSSFAIEFERLTVLV